MKKLLEWIEEEVAQAFEDAGYDRALGVVTPSNRRELRNTIRHPCRLRRR